MENVRKCYKEFCDYIRYYKSERPSAKEDFEDPEGEPICLKSFDTDIIYEYKDNIANKLLSLEDKNRLIYANIIITDLDLYYSILSGDSECEGAIISDWEFFMFLIVRAFSEFGIDLSEIAGKRKDLICDSNFLNGYNAGEKSRNINDFLKERKSECNRNCVSTSRQRIIAITQIMSEIYSGFENLEKTEQARFIQFLTGDESHIDNITNTNIYKNLKKIDKIQIGKDMSEDVLNGYNKDIEAVAQKLDNLGINKFADKIRGLKED